MDYAKTHRQVRHTHTHTHMSNNGKVDCVHRLALLSNGLVHVDFFSGDVTHRRCNRKPTFRGLMFILLSLSTKLFSFCDSWSICVSLSVPQDCVDIDECLDLPDACVMNSVCINTLVSRHEN